MALRTLLNAIGQAMKAPTLMSSGNTLQLPSAGLHESNIWGDADDIMLVHRVGKEDP